jgi:hypothetical protein
MSGSAQEVKARVDLKWGIPRFRHAREYFRTARGACQYAKVSSTCSLAYRLSYQSYHSVHHQEAKTKPIFLIYQVHSRRLPAVSFTFLFFIFRGSSLTRPLNQKSPLIA